MSGAFVLELAEPPGLAAFGLQGTPPGAAKPYRGFVESRGSGSPWFYTALSEVTGKWEEIYGVVTDGTPLDTLTRVVSFRSWNGSVLGTNSPINWQPGDGTLKIFANPISDIQDLILADYRGTSRPAWIQPGQRWRDSTGAPTSVVWKYWTGTLDIALGTFNETTGVFSAAGNYVPIAGSVTVTGPLTINGTLTLNGNPSINAANPILAPSANIGSGGNLVLLQSDGSIELLRTAGAAYIDFKDNAADDFDVRIAQFGANALAITAPGGASFSHALTVAGLLQPTAGLSGVAGLSNFGLFNNSGNAAFQGDGNDVLFYNRSGDFWSFFIGGVERGRIDSSGFVGMPFKKFQADGANQASLQVFGLSAVGPRFVLCFFELDRSGGTGGSFVIRTLTSGGSLITDVTMPAANDWCRGIAFSNSMFNGGRKVLQAIGIDGTVTPFHLANYNAGTTAQVDQVQVLHTGANVSGNLAVYVSS